MAHILPQADRDLPLLRSEMPQPRMAKANLRKAETAEFRIKVGVAVERTRTLSRLTLDEFAVKLRRDPRQVARWITGAERPQIDVIFAVQAFRKPLLIALAELVETGVEIDTVIRLRMKEAG